MFHFLSRSISRQLVAGISLAIGIMLALISYFIINEVNTNTKSQLESAISSIVSNQTVAVQGFFETKGQSIHSIFASPQVVSWFANYTERGSDINNDQSYRDIVKYFKYFSDNDKAIKSGYVPLNCC